MRGEERRSNGLQSGGIESGTEEGVDCARPIIGVSGELPPETATLGLAPIP